jgi:multimeric flavodoxin WrbA
MKAIGIVGSPRKGGNTEMLTSHALKALAEEGIEIELIPLAGLDIRGCTGCRACWEKETCSVKDDMWPIYEKMKQADGIIIASPVYFSSATSLVKGLMERTGYVAQKSGQRFRGKVGGSLVVARRAGHNATKAQMDYWFHILEFVMPGAVYWNMAFGRDKGEVLNDQEGLDTAWNFAKNMAELMKKLHGDFTPLVGKALPTDRPASPRGRQTPRAASLPDTQPSALRRRVSSTISQR